MSTIIVNNIEIEVTRKNIKNIHLSVHPPNGEVKISSPMHVNDNALILFVLSKMEWLQNQIYKFKIQEKVKETLYATGETHYLFGKPYLLNVIEIDKGSPKVEIRNKKYIDLYIKKESSKEKKEKIMKEWYREELKKEIPPLIEKWEEIIGEKVNDWGVKHMRTRWGSCNTKDRRIWINLELVKKPYHCLEYVIVHEIMHLVERGHGPFFQRLMDKFYPDWRTIKEELNRI